MGREIILASQSPRRRQLLQDAEIKFTVQSPDIEEHFPDDIPLQDVPSTSPEIRLRPLHKTIRIK